MPSYCKGGYRTIKPGVYSMRKLTPYQRKVRYSMPLGAGSAIATRPTSF